jgi:hypothetical protein
MCHNLNPEKMKNFCLEFLNITKPNFLGSFDKTCDKKGGIKESKLGQNLLQKRGLNAAHCPLRMCYYLCCNN